MPWPSDWLAWTAILVVVGAVVALLQPDVFTRGPTTTDQHRAEVDVHNLGEGVRYYQVVHRRLPATLQALLELGPDGGVANYFREGAPCDPWGRPYEYRVLARNAFRVLSTGEDGAPDTGDDICWPR